MKGWKRCAASVAIAGRAVFAAVGFCNAARRTP